MLKKYISELENKLSVLLDEARSKKERTKKLKSKYYFDGQSDAFGQILLDLKKLQYEFEFHADDDAESVEKNATTKRTRRPRRSKENVESPEDKYPQEAELLKEAKAGGLIVQKSSHYFYEAFTSGKQPGHVQGRINVLKELANEEVAQKIREKLAELSQAQVS
ncbi:hypothetical protein CSB45_03445 [candidate division KSB3 bacterium]|uniref:Uncharacterized protein n=1 Tax=candidate division KSB3 bacterium TaxID=2044937 RepID=A0A2G6EA12_9BACT|nr:MAG: hypothetical protein CSB45_03445 [candidate division KSB3 bacterium]PIE29549.1 MAG: hypothetical protein CSA57_08040 [candidate division KSB3 bacterium]